ncbi:hypothetical protein AB7M49_006981 [Bradyrhizobium elkanii]
MKIRLIDQSERRWHGLWSMRAAIGGGLFWSVVGGAIMVWPALAEKIPTILYVLGGVTLSAAFGLARVLKQPGAE